jgi:type IV secretory pathway VirB10-like protein
MNTFWLKIAAGALVVVIIAIGLSVLFSGKSGSSRTAPQPRVEEKPKTVYDSFARDDKKFAVKPEPEEPNEQVAAPSQPVVQQPTTQPATATQPQPQPKFRKLAIEEEVEAQKLFEMAKAQRKMGRLPMLGYKLMVDYCREIIRRWPDCQYAFLSKQMLADIPERYHETYHITKQELDTSSFYR